ncbi:MAG: flavodoxin domain-containing protein [Candidatus Aureabacteria bacterium]|nr:flavodoxin domain-containing protein [Candidatus Auribacterota bacterium]
MHKVLIIYYSRSGNTEKMARLIAEGVKSGGAEATVKRVEATEASELLNYQGIVIGSPTYYGTMSWEIKKLFDESVAFHGKLDGRVGAAFSSAANIGGGNETTVLAILEAMLIHGMVVQGDAEGDHYGRVSIDAPDRRVEAQCRLTGKRVAALVRKLFD